LDGQFFFELVELNVKKIMIEQQNKDGITFIGKGKVKKISQA
jgi:hypothetical protein